MIEGEGKQHRGDPLMFVLIQSQQSFAYNQEMTSQAEQASCHKKYSKISLKKRQILIELVINKGESLTKTSKKLNIKLSTAKLILRKFRKTGVLFNKNMSARCKKNERMAIESKQIAQQSQIYKRQQFQNGEARVKHEEEIQKDPPHGMIIPTVCYPSYQGSWIVYPWYSYPLHL